MSEVAKLIEQQTWIEPLETGLQKAISQTFASGGDAGRKVQDILHGTWLGHPLHVILTDVPLGVWAATLLFDILEASGREHYSEGADVTLQIGLAGALCAAAAGLTDWHVTDGPARRVGAVHGMLNLIGTGFYAASMVSRKKKERVAGRAFALAGFVLTSAAAYLGGTLVYGKQIGVNHTAGEPAIEDWTPALPEAELSGEKPRSAVVNGTRVLLARSEGTIRCIADVCSHLGGPLAEGEVRDGTVTCPWHGSCFSLRDGSVIHGPATHPQPSFETRTNAGQIEIRSAGGQE